MLNSLLVVGDVLALIICIMSWVGSVSYLMSIYQFRVGNISHLFPTNLTSVQTKFQKTCFAGISVSKYRFLNIGPVLQTLMAAMSKLYL